MSNPRVVLITGASSGVLAIHGSTTAIRQVASRSDGTNT